MHDEYRDCRHSNEELAAICVILRDSDWAAKVHPFCSHGQLGLSTSPDYSTARGRRAVWIASEADQLYSVTLQEGLGSANPRTERLTDLSEATLKSLVEWVSCGIDQ